MKPVYINGEPFAFAKSWREAAQCAGFRDFDAFYRAAAVSNGAISWVEAPKGFFIKMPEKG